MAAEFVSIGQRQKAFLDLETSSKATVDIQFFDVNTAA